MSPLYVNRHKAEPDYLHPIFASLRGPCVCLGPPKSVVPTYEDFRSWTTTNSWVAWKASLSASSIARAWPLALDPLDCVFQQTVNHTHSTHSPIK